MQSFFFSFPSCNLPFLSALPLWETKQNLLILCKTHLKDLTRFSKIFLAFLKGENPGRLRHLRNIQILLYSVLFSSYKGKLLRKGMLQKGHRKYIPPALPSSSKKLVFCVLFFKKYFLWEIKLFQVKKICIWPKASSKSSCASPTSFPVHSIAIASLFLACFPL